MATRPQRRNFVQDAPIAQTQQLQRRAAAPETEDRTFEGDATRLRPPQRTSSTAQVADFSQAQFIQALQNARAALGNWFEVACAVRQHADIGMTERKIQKWAGGNGPTSKTMTQLYPIILQIARSARK